MSAGANERALATSEQCERMSDWPFTNVLISRCTESLCLRLSEDYSWATSDKIWPKISKNVFFYWLSVVRGMKNPYIRIIFRFERISVVTWAEHRDEDVAFNTYSIWIIRIHHVYFIKHDLLFLRRLWIFHALSRSSLFPMMKIQCDTMARQSRQSITSWNEQQTYRKQLCLS